MAEIAEIAARAAGELLRARPASVTHKGAVDLVTEIDLASEARVRETLDRLAPGVPFQGEEGGGVTTGTRWVVDPLDGTTNFVHGYPFYCVSVALVEGERPVVGAIYDPVRDRLFRAHVGGGTTVNGEPVRVSETADLADALSVTGFPYDRRERPGFYLGFVERALRATQGMRRSGSAAMDLATICCGQADLFWEFGLKPWDTSAGVVLVQEAGGVVTRMDLAPHVPGAPDILATNGRFHDAVARMLGA